MEVLKMLRDSTFYLPVSNGGKGRRRCSHGDGVQRHGALVLLREWTSDYCGRVWNAYARPLGAALSVGRRRVGWVVKLLMV